MKIKVELWSVTPDAELLIEKCARTSYKSEGKIKEGSAAVLIKKLLGWGHESVLEHAVATFKISGISRACSHQLVRHRLVAITQKSQRYVNEEGFEFVIPPSVKIIENADVGFHTLMHEAQRYYEIMLEHGVPKEDARFVLPNACETELVMTANFREWRHICELRGSTGAQWEIRQVAVRVLEQLKIIAPNVFFDLNIEEQNGEPIVKK